MTGKSTTGIEQRAFPRAPIRSEIRIVYPDLKQLTSAICSDLSLGGMFVETEAPLPVSVPVHFELHLPARVPRVINGEGVVVWRRERVASTDPPPGFGVRFTQIDPRFRVLIFRLVDSFIQGGGKPFDLEEEPG